MTKIKVAVSEIKGKCDNGMDVGDYFIIHDGKISIPDGKSICIWTLNGMLPMFPFFTNTSISPDEVLPLLYDPHTTASDINSVI